MVQEPAGFLPTRNVHPERQPVFLHYDRGGYGAAQGTCRGLKALERQDRRLGFFVDAVAGKHFQERVEDEVLAQRHAERQELDGKPAAGFRGFRGVGLAHIGIHDQPGNAVGLAEDQTQALPVGIEKAAPPGQGRAEGLGKKIGIGGARGARVDPGPDLGMGIPERHADRDPARVLHLDLDPRLGQTLDPEDLVVVDPGVAGPEPEVLFRFQYDDGAFHGAEYSGKSRALEATGGLGYDIPA